tara:strand:+ start:3762 stop:4667 length:906 start_codon:yes stop_codon:yes gene_type:complete
MVLGEIECFKKDYKIISVMSRDKEETACPLCGSMQEKLLFMKDSFKIVACKKCELVYVNPRMKKQALEKAYNANNISPMDYYQESEIGDKKAFGKRLKLIERFIKGKGKMLDVGCNVGTFLEVAKESGWDCVGIDVNRGVANDCAKKGIKFFATTIEKAKFKKEFFDVIILNDVLEHVHEPVNFMQSVYKLLKKGGIVFLVTPNIKSLTAKVLRKRWHHLKPDEHLTYFSLNTLKVLLKKQKLDILLWKHVSRDRSFGIIFNKAASFGFAPDLNRFIPKDLQRITFPLNTFDELCIIARKR